MAFIATLGTHFEVLTFVFSKFEECNKLRRDKCQFLKPKNLKPLKSQIEYLGFMMDESGIKLFSARVQSIQNMRALRNVKMLRNFDCRFGDAMKGQNEASNEFIRRNVQEQSLNNVLRSSEFKMSHIDFSKMLVLETDVSKFVIADVLYQADFETESNLQELLYCFVL